MIPGDAAEGEDVTDLRAEEECDPDEEGASIPRAKAMSPSQEKTWATSRITKNRGVGRGRANRVKMKTNGINSGRGPNRTRPRRWPYR